MSAAKQVSHEIWCFSSSDTKKIIFIHEKIKLVEVSRENISTAADEHHTICWSKFWSFCFYCLEFSSILLTKKTQLWNMKLFKQKTDFIPQESTLLMQKQLKTEKCKFSHFSFRNVFLHFILLNTLTTCDGSGDRTSDLVVSTVSAGGANRISAAERVFQILHTQTEKRWSSQNLEDN